MFQIIMLQRVLVGPLDRDPMLGDNVSLQTYYGSRCLCLQYLPWTLISLETTHRNFHLVAPQEVSKVL